MPPKSSAPDTLPAGFSKWDAGPPDTLPANFKGFDEPAQRDFAAPRGTPELLPPVPQELKGMQEHPYEDAVYNTTGSIFGGAAAGATNTGRGLLNLMSMGRKPPIERGPASTPTKDEMPAYLGEQAAEFALPSGIVGKAGKGLDALAGASKLGKVFSLGGKMALEGASTAGVSAAHGESPEDIKTSGLIGAASPLLGAAVESAAKTLPQSIYTRIIRPGTKEFTLNEEQSAAKALSDQGMMGRSKRDLLQKTIAARQGVGKEIGSTLSAAPGTVDISPVISKIDDAMAKADAQGNPELHKQLGAMRDSLTRVYEGGQPTTALQPLNQLAPGEAAGIKTGLQRKINFTTPNADYLNDTRKGVAGGIGDILEKAVPDIGPLNDQYSGLSKARSALTRASAAEERNSPVSLYEALTGLTAAAGGSAAGGLPGGIGAGLVGGLGLKALRSVPVQTAVAQGIKKAPKAAPAAKALRNFYLAQQGVPNP